jgi:exonuclease III
MEGNINILAWNPRGLNNLARRLVVRGVVDEALASVVCISESKLSSVDRFIVMETFGPRFDGFAYLPALGTAGGIVVAWSTADVTVLNTRVDTFSVSVLLEPRGGEAWWLTAVYGPTDLELKGPFLDELRGLRATTAGAWAIVGDFNLIADARDKNNSRINQRLLSLFRDFINDLELKEANLLGRRYTWSNERREPTLVRLDRWFASVEWDDRFPDAALTARSSSLSDHCPIHLSTASVVRGKRRFRFERFWTKLQGFHDLVANSWTDPSASADPLLRLSHKLQCLSRDLRRWSLSKVGSIKDQLLVAHEIILQLDAAQDERRLSDDELWLRQMLKRRVLGLASLDRTIARQRARVASLCDTDANAQFFRVYASKRSKQNHISTLISDGRVVVDQADKEQVATDYFTQLLGTAQPRDHDLNLEA